MFSTSFATRELRRSGRWSTRGRSKRSFDSRSAYSLGSAVNDGTLDAGSHDRTAPSKAQTFAVGQGPMAVATELLPSWPGLPRPSTQRRLNDEADITANCIRLTEQGSPAVPLGSWSCVKA